MTEGILARVYFRHIIVPCTMRMFVVRMGVWAEAYCRESTTQCINFVGASFLLHAKYDKSL